MSKAVSSADHVLSAEETQTAMDRATALAGAAPYAVGDKQDQLYEDALMFSALAASHELLRAERDEAQKIADVTHDTMEENEYLRARAVAGGQAADALREIIALAYTDESPYYPAVPIARAAVAEWDRQTG